MLNNTRITTFGSGGLFVVVVVHHLALFGPHCTGRTRRNPDLETTRCEGGHLGRAATEGGALHVRERERVASFVWGCPQSVGFGGPRVVFVMSRGKKRSVAGGIDSSSHFFGCFEIMESVAHKTKESKCQTWICHWIRLRKNDARRRQLRVSS